MRLFREGLKRDLRLFYFYMYLEKSKWIREKNSSYYEKQLAQLGRAADLGLQVAGSNPALFLLLHPNNPEGRG